MLEKCQSQIQDQLARIGGLWCVDVGVGIDPDNASIGVFPGSQSEDSTREVSNISR